MFKNYTPHEVTIYDADGKEIIARFPSEGNARCSIIHTLFSEIEGLPVYHNEFSSVEGLPPPEEGITFIVSYPVLQADSNRTDLVGPDTTPQGVVRDVEGRILGVKGFQIL